MQRLFSTFANGLPGKGLLLLRVAVTSFELHTVTSRIVLAHPDLSLWVSLCGAVAGLLLLAGIWTPVVGVFIAALHGTNMLFRLEPSWDDLLAGSVALALSVLGPGAYSLDARLYGRKRIAVDD